LLNEAERRAAEAEASMEAEQEVAQGTIDGLRERLKQVETESRSLARDQRLRTSKSSPASADAEAVSMEASTTASTGEVSSLRRQVADLEKRLLIAERARDELREQARHDSEALRMRIRDIERTSKQLHRI